MAFCVYGAAAAVTIGFTMLMPAGSKAHASICRQAVSPSERDACIQLGFAPPK